MDRVLPRTPFYKRPLLYAIVAPLGFAIGYLLVAGQMARNSYSVPAAAVQIATVSQGPFQEYIPIDAVVVPAHTIYLDAHESGIVEKVFVEDGAVLQPGQPLLQLQNTELALELINRETAVLNLLNELENTRMAMEQNSIRLRQQLADIDFALLEARRRHELNEQLFKEKVVAKQDFQQTANEMAYQQRRLQLTKAALVHDSVSAMKQMSQMRQTLTRLRANMTLMQSRQEDLLVKAPAAGRLTSLSAEPGQNINRGQRLGQLDLPQGFKLRALVDEHYLPRITEGITARFDYEGREYEARTTKVYSQVSDNKFTVDLALNGQAPASMRRGQTFALKLSLGRPDTAVLLPRGGFFQATGGYWIYKLNGSRAQRQAIALDRQNPDFYEVKTGLQPGDRVLINSYQTFPEEAKEITVEE